MQINQKVPSARGTRNSDIETPTVDTPPALTPEKDKLLFSKIALQVPKIGILIS